MAEVSEIIHDTITRYCDERGISTGPMFFLTDRLVFALQREYEFKKKKDTTPNYTLLAHQVDDTNG
jgi:hypothetical protein